jgi:tRNA threonylcarbamoyladenosine biosynthesis protein TsaB
MELSIETSTRYASVGLSEQGSVVAQLSWRSERNHSVELVPAIQRLMGHVGAEIGHLEAIFVAGGPGAFSALRVGMSTAKGLAVARNLPLVSVGTLDIEAQPYLSVAAGVCAVIEAGRGRVYAGWYGSYRDAGAPRHQVLSYDELVSATSEPTLFCGEGAPAVADLLRDRLGGAARLAEAPPPTRSASALALLGYGRWRTGSTDDPATLQPWYLPRNAQVDAALRTWVPAS